MREIKDLLAGVYFPHRHHAASDLHSAVVLPVPSTAATMARPLGQGAT